MLKIYLHTILFMVNNDVKTSVRSNAFFWWLALSSYKSSSCILFIWTVLISAVFDIFKWRYYRLDVIFKWVEICRYGTLNFPPYCSVSDEYNFDVDSFKTWWIRMWPFNGDLDFPPLKSKKLKRKIPLYILFKWKILVLGQDLTFLCFGSC